MAATTKSKPRAAAVSRETIESAGNFLESLPEKPKEDLSLRESMGHMKESIQAALAKGYSYQDLADLLGKQGINISATTLKNYVPTGKRQAAKDKKTSSTTTTKRGRKPKASSASDDGSAKAAESNGVSPSKTSSTSRGRKPGTTTKAKSAPATRAKTTTRAKSSSTPKSTRGRKKAGS